MDSVNVKLHKALLKSRSIACGRILYWFLAAIYAAVMTQPVKRTLFCEPRTYLEFARNHQNFRHTRYIENEEEKCFLLSAASNKSEQNKYLATIN